MKFSFRLEPVLNIKTQSEDILKAELGHALKILDSENKKLDLLNYQNKKNMDEYRVLLNNVVSLTDINKYNTYFSKQKEKIRIQKEKINIEMENVDKIRKELIKVSQEKEMLEKLKKKKRISFKNMQLKEEQKLNNELVTYRQNIKLAEDG